HRALIDRLPGASRRRSRAPRRRVGSGDADRAHGVRNGGGDEPSLHACARPHGASAARRGSRVKVVLLHTADALEPPVDPVLDQLDAALGANGHAVKRLVVDGRVEELARGLRGAEADLVFNIAESFGCQYTGSSPAGLMLAGDKTLTKKVLGFHGIQTPQFATLYRGAVDWAGDLRFPVIVKPPQEDASLGISSASVVHELKDLFDRIDALQTEFQQPVLVEQYIEGREFYVGVLGNANVAALPVIELDFSHFPPDRPRIASWEAKWGEDGAGS